MIVPAHPSFEYIAGQVAFYESGVAWYEAHCQKRLAEWSRQELAKWRAKMEEFHTGRKSGDGE